MQTRRCVSVCSTMRMLGLALLAILFSMTVGCSRPTTAVQSRTPEAYISAPGSVGFDIKPVAGENGARRFLATYQSQGRLAKFAFEFGPTRTAQGVETGQGRFLAEPGSDASVLLSDLQKALEAKVVPNKVRRVEILPFMFVNLGDNLSQAPSGGFNAKPPGNWTAIKIFIGDGAQEGDVFLNFNVAIGKGQFSTKDADYGDLVIQHLATVL
jgi:hypothetical protein